MSPPSDDSKPRRDTVEPVSLRAKRPPSPDDGRSAAGHELLLRRWTLAGFGMLLVLAIGVFFLLPSAVERGREADRAEGAAADSSDDPGDVAPERGTAARPEADLQDPEALAARSLAEETLADFAALENILEAQDVTSWAAGPFAEARARVREGERLLRDRRYRDAADRMAEAVAALTELEARGRTLFDEALRSGRIALEAGAAEDAREQFEIAARIRSSDRAALAGLVRAETIEEVFSLLQAGNELEAQGDLASALERYAAGAALDSEALPLQLALQRVRDQLAREAFEASMSRAFGALARGDYDRANSAFSQALRMRPDAPAARDGLAQAVGAARNRDVNRHRERADQFESEERWHEAREQYRAALTLDPGVAFAQLGAPRSQRRAELSDSLDSYLNAPQRLSSEKVRREATTVLARADAVRRPGPVLRSQIDSVAKLLREMSTPVIVELLSDAETDVLLYHVGRLGRFEARRLELTPGRYTVVGTRPGYRDVRTQFTVGAGSSPPPVTVRCEEKI